MLAFWRVFQCFVSFSINKSFSDLIYLGHVQEIVFRVVIQPKLLDIAGG